MTPSGMGLLVCVAGSHPSRRLGVVRRTVRWSRIMYPLGWGLGPTPGLGPILCLPPPFWWLKKRLLKLLIFWFSFTESMLSFARLGCRISAGLDIQWLRLISSWILLSPLFLSSLFWRYPGSLDGNSWRWRGQKSPLRLGQMVDIWNEIESLPLARFSGLAILLNMVETSAIWPQGLLDAFLP